MPVCVNFSSMPTVSLSSQSTQFECSAMNWHLFADKYPLWRKHRNQLPWLGNNENILKILIKRELCFDKRSCQSEPAEIKFMYEWRCVITSITHFSIRHENSQTKWFSPSLSISTSGSEFTVEFKITSTLFYTISKTVPTSDRHDGYTVTLSHGHPDQCHNITHSYANS
jgi:hypothetical protein